MTKYILMYNYTGEKTTFTLESEDIKYLKHKIVEFSSIAERSIEYKLFGVIEEGIEEYEDID